MGAGTMTLLEMPSSRVCFGFARTSSQTLQTEKGSLVNVGSLEQPPSRKGHWAVLTFSIQ